LEEAHDIIATLRTITRHVVPSDVPFRNPEDTELFLSGLRLATADSA
jgi:hypothetical protein